VIGGDKSMNISTLVRLMLIGAMLAAGATGCKHDPALSELNRLKQDAIKRGFDVEEKSVELALSKWQNGRMDREPIMLWAQLGKPIGMETKDLTFFTFDEDKDIVGFGIVEEYIDANGLRTTLTEEYETTANGPYPPDEAVQAFAFQVQIRDAGQRKDVKQWNEYLDAKSRDVKAGRELPPVGKTWHAMPPIWISMPEPNRVEVYVYVYDRQGHKSERIRVNNSIREEQMRVH
jgi:hypothetical protein